jgi:intracellular sulfur oxidation DsrE/DsrF family protein
MLSQGEGDRVGEYATTIADLRARGVHFVACHNSMTVFGIAPAKLVAGAQIVPAGVVELVRLQNAEHYAYIKP